MDVQNAPKRGGRAEIIKALQSEEKALRSQLDIAIAQKRAAVEDLDRVKAALAALRGEWRASPRRVAGDRKRRRRIPTASLEEYASLVREILTEQGEMSRQELFRVVGKRVANLGKSRVGIAVRIPKALESLGFEDRNGRCRAKPEV